KAQRTSSRGEGTISTSRPRSKRRITRRSPPESEKATLNQRPMISSSGSALTRAAARASQSSLNSTDADSTARARRRAPDSPARRRLVLACPLPKGLERQPFGAVGIVHDFPLVVDEHRGAGRRVEGGPGRNPWVIGIAGPREGREGGAHPVREQIAGLVRPCHGRRQIDVLE